MPLLRDWPRDPAARDAYVDSIFGSIARRYDFFTRALSFGREKAWKERAAGAVPAALAAGRVLDLASGTGAFPLLLRARGFHGAIVGVDRSLPMLAIARRRLAARGLADVPLVLGDLNALPVGEGTMDAVTMGYGLRYLSSIPDTLMRLHRILKPGGFLVSLDFGVPPSPWFRSLATAYLLAAGTLWGLLLHGRAGTYWHIVESLRAYPGQRAVAAWLREAGFEEVVVGEELGGIAAIITARKPGHVPVAAADRPGSAAAGVSPPA
jgi:demethylmenaquinone methyltransferase / 2-methoxy-6-polyprenyl-1,4-benzoquinol methylase